VSDLKRLSALHGQVVPGNRLGANRDASAGICLRERRLTAILQLNGAPPGADIGEHVKALKPAPAPLRACAKGSVSLLWNGPGMWLVTSPDQAVAEVRAAMEKALAGTDATLTDLTQARTVITVEGANARELVAKACPLDIDAMVSGDTSPSVLGHFNVQVHCVSQQCFDLYVFRSFGLALWEWLIEESLEFGCETP